MLWQRRLLSSSHARAIAARPSKFLRYYSSSTFDPAEAFQAAGSENNNVFKIWYASQGGTAQLFAHQLAEGMEEEMPDCNVTVQGLHEQPPESFHSSSSKNDQEEEDPLHFFLVSVAGVGEVPDNGRDFWDWIMKQQQKQEDWKSVNYAVFGLGNQQAHPNHYNVIGKKLDAQLEALGANRFQPLGLGDDGDCLDDDFDQWMEDTLRHIMKSSSPLTNDTRLEEETTNDDSPAEAEQIMDMKQSQHDSDDDHPRISCPNISKRSDGTRRISKKYPTLSLEPATSDIVRPDLFFLQDTPNAFAFYSSSTFPMTVLQNEILTVDAGESGMHELQMALPPPPVVQEVSSSSSNYYTSGDHLLIYPRNSDAIVQAYLDLLDVDPHATIVTSTNEEATTSTTTTKKYPYPTGITVMETLMHCVDLGAPPSPALSRMLLGKVLGNDDLDYKEEIASPRRTIMDVILERERNGHPSKLSLEDLLYQATPMKPRYYSIASSNVQYPNHIHLTYRPVKYVTSHGYLREGLCTSFLLHKGVLPQQDSSDQEAASIPASIAPHPSFRLPSSPETPVIMIGGGCGVAPIRAFLQERIYLASKNNINFGPGILYMGYRNPQDEVYREIVKEALESKALTDAKIVYSSGCTNPVLVSELIRKEGATVWEHMESGGHIYICGGAYAFGATVKAELLDLVQEHGKMTFEESEAYLRSLTDQGRFAADLAD